jgi:hypothetical protein
LWRSTESWRSEQSLGLDWINVGRGATEDTVTLFLNSEEFPYHLNPVPNV